MIHKEPKYNIGDQPFYANTGSWYIEQVTIKDYEFWGDHAYYTVEGDPIKYQDNHLFATEKEAVEYIIGELNHDIVIKQEILKIRQDLLSKFQSGEYQLGHTKEKLSWLDIVFARAFNILREAKSVTRKECAAQTGRPRCKGCKLAVWDDTGESYCIDEVIENLLTAINAYKEANKEKNHE